MNNPRYILNIYFHQHHPDKYQGYTKPIEEPFSSKKEALDTFKALNDESVKRATLVDNVKGTQTTLKSEES